MTFSSYASVILDIAIDKTLDYGLTQEQIDLARRGTRVAVPVKGRLQSGYIFEIKSQPSYSPVKGVAKLLSNEELIRPDLFDLALWMAKYYCAPLRQVLKMMLPASVRGSGKHKQQLFVMRAKTRDELKDYCELIRNKASSQAEVLDIMLTVKKGILLTELLEATKGSRAPVDALTKKGYLLLETVKIDRSPLVGEEYFQTKPKALNSEQAKALAKIADSLDASRFETHLLYGVTGSGKTEIYLQAIDRALNLGKGAIMLVPEISLTQQTVERFRSRFEGNIALLHHRLSQGERFDEWNRIRNGEARIVIGARSAVFSPVANLGLIIVDEEHESSYKATEEAPCYHARDIAVMRGKMTGSSVILGSATPSLESYHNAETGKYNLSTLTHRAESTQLPQVTIIDMRREFDKSKGATSFSDALLSAIKKRMATGEQTILFLNRRGYHTMLWCPQCTQTAKCRHCDVSLTFHLGDNCLSCHLCQYTLSPPPRQCPSCHADNPLKFRGVGTEQVEKALHAILPGIRTLRLDADTTRHKGSQQKLLRDFGSGKADVLIGTQMIAKGLHFPEVTLVGILNSDSSLNIPDFRASETVFQLITQVSGRAGRGVTPGEVILQTAMPDNMTIQLAATQNYTKFYDSEIALRKLFGYPPFSQIAKVAFSGSEEEATAQHADAFRQMLQSLLAKEYELLPVVPAGHSKVKDRFRFQFLVKGPAIQVVSRAIDAARAQLPLPSHMHLLVDINPLSTFF
ncbi:MAG: primosomal protein N' [Parachlamydia sp.]|nr:primosomal protein N' [Parachlamydia sp.]